MKILKILFLNCLLLFTMADVFGQKLPAFSYGGKDTITVYYNLNQKLKIDFRGTDPSFTKIKIGSTTMRGVNISQADSSIFIFVNSPVEDFRMKLYYKNLPIDIIDVKIERMPATDLILNIADQGNISKQILGEIKALQPSIPVAYIEDLNLEIYSYNLRLIRPGKNPEIIPCFNIKLTDQALSKIIALPENSYIMIENVRLKTPQNNVIELEGPGKTYQIKS